MANIAVQPAPAHITFDGQSMNITGGYPTKLMAYYPTIPSATIAKGGWSVTLLEPQFAGRARRYAKAGVKSILIFSGGYSDVENEGDTGSTLYSDHVAHAAAARALGFTHVLALTLTPSLDFAGAEETARTTFNTALIADASDAFDAVVDVANATNLTDASNTTYYSDGVHWTSAGAQIAADTVKPYVDTVLGV